MARIEDLYVLKADLPQAALKGLSQAITGLAKQFQDVGINASVAFRSLGNAAALPTRELLNISKTIGQVDQAAASLQGSLGKAITGQSLANFERLERLAEQTRQKLLQIREASRGDRASRNIIDALESSLAQLDAKLGGVRSRLIKAVGGPEEFAAAVNQAKTLETAQQRLIQQAQERAEREKRIVETRRQQLRLQQELVANIQRQVAAGAVGGSGATDLLRTVGARISSGEIRTRTELEKVVTLELQNQAAALQRQALIRSQNLTQRRRDITNERELTKLITEYGRSQTVIVGNQRAISQAITQSVREAQKLGLAFDRDAAAVRRLAAEVFALQRARTAAQPAGGASIGGGRGSLNDFGGAFALSLLSTQVLRGVTDITRRFSEFEDQLIEVEKTADATKETAAVLGNEILRLGQQVPVLARDLGAAAAALGQVGAINLRGLSGTIGADTPQIREAVKAIELVGEVAISTDLDIQTVAKSYGQLAAIFSQDSERIQKSLKDVGVQGVDTADAMRVLFGSLNEVSNQTVATVRDSLQFIQNFGGVAAAAGVTFEQVSGLAGAIRDLGTSPQVAGTALSRFFLEASKRAEDFGRVLGVSGDQFRAEFSTDAFGSILKVFEALREQTRTNKLAIADFLGTIGAESRQRNAITKLIENLDVVKKDLAIASDLTQNYASIQEEAEKRTVSWSASVTLLSNSLTSVANAAKPVISAFASLLRILADLITTVASNPVGQIFVQIGLGVSAVVGAAAALGAMAFILKLNLSLVRGMFAPLNLFTRSLEANSVSVAKVTVLHTANAAALRSTTAATKAAIPVLGLFGKALVAAAVIAAAFKLGNMIGEALFASESFEEAVDRINKASEDAKRAASQTFGPLLTGLRESRERFDKSSLAIEAWASATVKGLGQVKVSSAEAIKDFVKLAESANNLKDLADLRAQEPVVRDSAAAERTAQTISANNALRKSIEDVGKALFRLDGISFETRLSLSQTFKSRDIDSALRGISEGAKEVRKELSLITREIVASEGNASQDLLNRQEELIAQLRVLSEARKNLESAAAGNARTVAAITAAERALEEGIRAQARKASDRVAKAVGTDVGIRIGEELAAGDARVRSVIEKFAEESVSNPLTKAALEIGRKFDEAVGLGISEPANLRRLQDIIRQELVDKQFSNLEDSIKESFGKSLKGLQLAIDEIDLNAALRRNVGELALFDARESLEDLREVAAAWGKVSDEYRRFQTGLNATLPASIRSVTDNVNSLTDSFGESADALVNLIQRGLKGFGDLEKFALSAQKTVKQLQFDEGVKAGERDATRSINQRQIQRTLAQSRDARNLVDVSRRTAQDETLTEAERGRIIGQQIAKFQDAAKARGIEGADLLVAQLKDELSSIFQGEQDPSVAIQENTSKMVALLQELRDAATRGDGGSIREISDRFASLAQDPTTLSRRRRDRDIQSLEGTIRRSGLEERRASAEDRRSALQLRQQEFLLKQALSSLGFDRRDPEQKLSQRDIAAVVAEVRRLAGNLNETLPENARIRLNSFDPAAVEETQQRVAKGRRGDGSQIATSVEEAAAQVGRSADAQRLFGDSLSKFINTVSNQASQTTKELNSLTVRLNSAEKFINDAARAGSRQGN
jgi:TP901 family phage tail tape measure protein